MSIEFDKTTNQAQFNYRTNPRPFAEQPGVVQEAILTVAGKARRDIYSDEKRAVGCGCNTCQFRASETKEWYK